MNIIYLRLTIYSTYLTSLLVLLCSSSGILFYIATFISLVFANWFRIATLTSLSNSSIAIDRTTRRLILVTLFVSLLIAIFGYQHDYVAYVKQWSLIIKGQDPWIGTGNAYGPIHNAFSPLILVHKILPKLIFYILFVGSLFVSSVAKLNISSDISLEKRYFNFALFSLCPFSIITAALYGNNDSIVSALLVLSFYLSIAYRNRLGSFSSGILLAISTMIKIYPLIMAPSFIFKKRKVDFIFLSSFLTSLTLIFSAAYFIWGKSTFIPILFASARNAKHLSFFFFIKQNLNFNLDFLSIYLVIIVFLICFAITQFFKMDLLPSALITFGSVLSVYKVGNQQFFLFFFAVTPLLIRYLSSVNPSNRSGMISAYGCWLGYLNFYQIQYHLSCGMRDGVASDFKSFGSIGYILITALLCYQIFKSLHRYPDSLSTPLNL